jgi:hypothetical protein
MLDLRPLRSVGFRHLVTAQWINECGNWIGEVALAILVYDKTKSALATALLFLSLRFLPALLAPLLTARAEAWHPRIALPLMYLVEAAVFAVVASTANKFSLPLTLTLVAIDGVCAISTATLNRTAMATGLVADGLLREGNSVLNLGATAATAGAPVVAGVLVAANGAATALLIDAATFLVAALIVATASGVRIESDREAGFAGRIKAGIAVLRGTPSVRRLLIATALTFGLSQVAIPVEVIFAKTTLHAGDAGYGLLLTSWGAGMIGGAAVFAAGDRLRLMPMLGVGTFLIAFGYAGIALSPTIAVACALSVVGGIGNGVSWVAAKTALQERIPLSNQSAVLSVLDGLNQVLPALGFIAGGALATLASPRAAYAVSAVGVGLLLVLFLMRPLDSIPLQTVEPQDDSLSGRSDRHAENLTDLDTWPLSTDLQENSPATRTSLAAPPLANG